jgi:hypothetical protein
VSSVMSVSDIVYDKDKVNIHHSCRDSFILYSVHIIISKILV